MNDSGLGREQWFGRVVLQTHDREVYSLGLYETHAAFAPGFTVKGYYLLCNRYYLPCNPGVLPTGVVAHRSVPPKSAPVGVELTIDDSAFNATSEMLGAGIFCGGGAPWERDAPYLGNPELGGPWRDLSPVFSAQVSAPLRLPD